MQSLGVLSSNAGTLVAEALPGLRPTSPLESAMDSEPTSTEGPGASDAELAPLKRWVQAQLHQTLVDPSARPQVTGLPRASLFARLHRETETLRKIIGAVNVLATYARLNPQAANQTPWALATLLGAAENSLACLAGILGQEGIHFRLGLADGDVGELTIKVPTIRIQPSLDHSLGHELNRLAYAFSPANRNGLALVIVPTDAAQWSGASSHREQNELRLSYAVLESRRYQRHRDFRHEVLHAALDEYGATHPDYRYWLFFAASPPGAFLPSPSAAHGADEPYSDRLGFSEIATLTFEVVEDLIALREELRMHPHSTGAIPRSRHVFHWAFLGQGVAGRLIMALEQAEAQLRSALPSVSVSPSPSPPKPISSPSLFRSDRELRLQFELPAVISERRLPNELSDPDAPLLYSLSLPLADAPEGMELGKSTSINDKDATHQLRLGREIASRYEHFFSEVASVVHDWRGHPLEQRQLELVELFIRRASQLPSPHPIHELSYVAPGKCGTVFP